MVPHRDAADPACQHTRARMVCSAGRAARLVAHDAGTEHQEPPATAPGRGGDQLRGTLAGARFGAGARHAERPLPVRLSRPGPRRARARDRERLDPPITRFLLELGAGFAFVGRQFRLEVAGDEFFIDLLFYHTRLKCYVVVELKATGFKPEHAGQLNFYLTAVDSQIKAPDDNPTIGLLLCKQQNRLVAEYALSGIDKP